LQLNEPDAEPRRPRQDNLKPDARAARAGLADDLVLALRFYSRLPTGSRPFEPPDLNRIAMALPLASLVIGLGPVLLAIVLHLLHVPALVAAALGVGAMIAVTGGMADDAIADAADGLFGGTNPERRLEIMKDSRHGTYGVAALALYIIIRVGAFAEIAAGNVSAAGAIWLAATLIARPAALWLSLALPPARRDGVSANAGRVGRLPFAMGLGLSALLALIVAGPFTSFAAILLALIVTALIVWGWSRLCLRLVGGQTGDLIGALQALLEIGVLVALSIFA
jgi:adenosylcobinamide-GDP ribazoletransferase